MEDVVDQAKSAVQSLGDSKDKLTQDITTCVNECGEELTNALISSALETFSTQTEEAISKIGEVSNFVEQVNETFDGSDGEVVDKVEDIADIIDTIKPALELVETVLG